MASNFSADQWFPELLENRRQFFLKSEDSALWRAECKADITVVKTVRESTPGIGSKNLAIPTFEEMVDVASRESLRSDFTSIVMLEADENTAQEIIEEMVQTTVSNLREIEAKGRETKKSRAGKEVGAIITARRAQFCYRIERAISDVEMETRYLRQSLGWIATCPNEAEREAARETAVGR